MDVEDLVLVATVREDIRNRALQVHVAEIPGSVEAAQARKRIPPAVPTSGTVKHESSLTGPKRASNGYENDGEAVEKQDAQENIDVRTEGLTQLMQDSKAEVTTRYEARVEAVRYMVKEAERKAEAEEMKQKAEAAECEAEAARVAKLKAEVVRLQAEVTSMAGRKAQTAGSSVEDEWASPVKSKAKKGSTEEDEWASPVKSKAKKGSSEEDEWAWAVSGDPN